MISSIKFKIKVMIEFFKILLGLGLLIICLLGFTVFCVLVYFFKHGNLDEYIKKNNERKNDRQ